MFTSRRVRAVIDNGTLGKRRPPASVSISISRQIPTLFLRITFTSSLRRPPQLAPENPSSSLCHKDEFRRIFLP